MKYTAEEVRDYADACRLLHKGPVIADMLTAYAERIKADEGATQVAWQYRYKNNRMEWSAWHEWAPEEHEENPFPKTIGRWEVEYRKLFTHPPAQAAQVDPAKRAIGELLAVIHGDGGHYLARHGVEKAATDALPKVYALMQEAAQQADR